MDRASAWHRRDLTLYLLDTNIVSMLDQRRQRNAPDLIDWLKRTVEVSPPSPWTPGARHNLGRCYEQMGRADLARQWLQSDADSPQRYGNLLRAKWLTDGK